MVDERIESVYDLIVELRHSIAHFDFEINSMDENFLFDEIIFSDNHSKKGLIAIIKASEFLTFFKNYAGLLIENLSRHYRE